jgi:hypothetical protein
MHFPMVYHYFIIIIIIIKQEELLINKIKINIDIMDMKRHMLIFIYFLKISMLLDRGKE